LKPPEDPTEFRAEPAFIATNGTSPQNVLGTGSPPVRRKRSALMTFFIVGTILAVVAPVLAYGIALLTHAGPFGDNVFPVTLHNDTQQTLVVRTCGDNCTPQYQSVSLAPDNSVRVGATTGQMTRYYLHDSTGALLGCLPLKYPKPLTGVTVQASQQEACPGNPLPAP
jgi:hypothetical protein